MANLLYRLDSSATNAEATDSGNEPSTRNSDKGQTREFRVVRTMNSFPLCPSTYPNFLLKYFERLPF
jgi:hypothetical protein